MFTHDTPVQQTEIERLEELIEVQEWMVNRNYGKKGVVARRIRLEESKQKLSALLAENIIESEETK